MIALLAVLSSFLLTGPVGSGPPVRIDPLDMCSVRLCSGSLIVGDRLVAGVQTEVVLWSPFYGHKSLAAHLAARGSSLPDGVEHVEWCWMEANQLVLIVTGRWVGATGSPRWVIFLRDPTSFPCPPADFDCDGDVDQTDFGLLQARLGEQTTTVYDLNRDGVVTAADIDKFKSLLTGE